MFERAQTIGHTLWVNAQRDDERSPCGEFPTQRERRGPRAAGVDVASFWLKPDGFFDRNPALDVPPSH